MGRPILESDQARWAQECCRGGNCPICNGDNDDDRPTCICCGDELSDEEIAGDNETCFPCQKGNRECCNETEE